MDFVEWFNELTGNDTQRIAAKRSGLIESTLSRQLSRGTFRPEMVIALCRGYDRSPVTGLIETGYIEPWETEGVAIPYALEQATNQQILDEIMRRSDPEARALFTSAGDPDTVDLADSTDAEVYHLPERSDAAELQAVHDALTPYEHRLVDAGKAPDLLTLTDLETWRAAREDAIPERAVADRSPRQGRGYPDDYEP